MRHYSIYAKIMVRKLKRAIYFLAAAIFLLEAWLWDNLYPIVERLVAWLPWEQAKKYIANKIQHFPPWACVFTFAIPALLILPLKILWLWLITEHHSLLGGTVFIFAKMVGLGVSAFLFETCRGKLLSISWCLWLYNTLIKIRNWAKLQVAPAIEELQKIKARILHGRGKTVALLKGLRRNSHAKRAKQQG